MPTYNRAASNRTLRAALLVITAAVASRPHRSGSASAHGPGAPGRHRSAAKQPTPRQQHATAGPLYRVPPATALPDHSAPYESSPPTIRSDSPAGLALAATSAARQW